MLEELFNLVKGSAEETVVNNPAISNEHNDDVVAEATNTVASGFRNMVAGGGVESIISLLKGNNNNGNQQQNTSGLLSNPIVNMMVGHLTGKLMSKFNLNGSQASGVASDLIPSVISNLINKTNDPGSSNFSIENLLNSITGGAQAQQQKNGGGGLMDLIKGFVK